MSPFYLLCVCVCVTMDPSLSIFLCIFSTCFLSINSTPLLSLRCIPSSNSNQTNDHQNMINPIKTLLDNFTSGQPNSSLTTSSITFGQERYMGLMQCQPGHNLKKCTLCARTAHDTVSNLCYNSTAFSAWFDGCYIQIFSTMASSFNQEALSINLSNHSCSNWAKNQDPAQFSPALEALLLKLRADINIPTHHGFSHGQISYQNTNHSDSKIYALVECVRSLSPQECNSCIAKATEKLQLYCGGKSGGTVVDGLCLVRFDSNEFYRGEVNHAGRGASGNFTLWEGENGGCERKVVMAYWGAGVGCFLVLVLLALLLRRAVLDRAKVGALECDETAGKATGNGI